MASPDMTPQMLGALANHLYQEGNGAYQQGNLNEAMIWYAQCLDILGQLGNNKDVIASILYYVGVIYALAGRHSQALGFFEAVINIEQQQEVEESTADLIKVAGKALAQLGYFEVGKRGFDKALEMYQALNLQAQSDQARQRMDELEAESQADRSRFIQNKDQALEFVIRVGEKPVTGLTVELDGALGWETFGGLDQEVAVGRVHPWNVICANPYRK